MVRRHREHKCLMQGNTARCRRELERSPCRTRLGECFVKRNSKLESIRSSDALNVNFVARRLSLRRDVNVRFWGTLTYVSGVR